MPVAPFSDEAREHNRKLPGQGGVFNPVNLALYHYAGNNPVKYVDPNGLSAIYHRDIFAGNDSFLKWANKGGFDHWLVVVNVSKYKNDIMQYTGNKNGFSNKERVGTRSYIVEYSGMDDNLIAKAIENVRNMKKYGSGSNDEAKKKYNPFFNNCNSFTSDVFKEYKKLWIDNQKELHKDDDKFNVNKAWKEHYKEITADKGKEVWFKDLNKNIKAAHPKVEDKIKVEDKKK